MIPYEKEESIMTHTIGCFCIIFKSNKILLVKRKDFPLWDLPGGRKEQGESEIACVIREAKEECGYSISIDQEIGRYKRAKYQDTQVVFSTHILEECIDFTSDETKCIKWFPLHKLPYNLVPNRRLQIQHFKKGYSQLEISLKDHHPLLVLQRFYKFLHK